MHVAIIQPLSELFLGVEPLGSKEERRGILNVMASEREVFELSGPLHLASVDW